MSSSSLPPPCLPASSAVVGTDIIIKHVCTAVDKEKRSQPDVNTFEEGAPVRKRAQVSCSSTLQSGEGEVVASNCTPSRNDIVAFGIEDQVDALTAGVAEWSLCGSIQFMGWIRSLSRFAFLDNKKWREKAFGRSDAQFVKSKQVTVIIYWI